MNALSLLAIGGAVYGLTRITGKVDAVKAFKYGLSAWPKVSFQNGQVILDIPLTIKNVSRESFDIQKVYGEMFVKGQYVGDFLSNSRVVISAYGKSPVPVTVSAFLTNAISSLISAFVTKSGEAAFTLKGRVVTSLVTIPFSQDF